MPKTHAWRRSWKVWDAQVFLPVTICHPTDEFVLYDVFRHGALPFETGQKHNNNK